MKRYQVYLNPNSVSVLDDFQKYARISRSKLIQEAIDRLAQNLSHIFVVNRVKPQTPFVLDSLVGSIHTKSGTQTNYAAQDDDRYLVD